MPINSKRKGAAGEREWAKVCREQGFVVRRTQQYAGGTEESADCIGLPYIHQEVKRVEKLNIYEAMEQSYWDNVASGKSETDIPIVAHRKNGKSWLITMSADDWFKLYKEYFAGKEIANHE